MATQKARRLAHQAEAAIAPLKLTHPSGSTMAKETEEALAAIILAASAASVSYSPKELKRTAVELQTRTEPNRPFPPAYVPALRAPRTDARVSPLHAECISPPQRPVEGLVEALQEEMAHGRFLG